MRLIDADTKIVVNDVVKRAVVQVYMQYRRLSQDHALQLLGYDAAMNTPVGMLAALIGVTADDVVSELETVTSTENAELFREPATIHLADCAQTLMERGTLWSLVSKEP